MTVRQRLYEIALEKNLRQSTVYSYERLLAAIGLIDEESPSRETVTQLLWTIDNPNTRRATVIAVRSVLGFDIKIPKGVPRRYNLPDEDTLRLALMTSPHETRGLLMMYAGLRIGEACAVGPSDLDQDRLSVTRQVLELTKTGQPTIVRLAPVKTTEASVIIPWWLTTLVNCLERTEKPSSVRESLRRSGKRAGVAINPHMLRHWYATTMLARGIPMALVSKQMRHSDIVVTLRTYQQFSEGDIHKTFG